MWLQDDRAQDPRQEARATAAPSRGVVENGDGAHTRNPLLAISGTFSEVRLRACLQTLHRPDASEQLVQRSGQESAAVQQYSQALRAMSAEIERHDGWGELDPRSIQDVSGGSGDGGGSPRSAGRPVIEAPDEDSKQRHEIDLLPPIPAINIQYGNARLTTAGVVIGGTDQQTA